MQKTYIGVCVVCVCFCLGIITKMQPKRGAGLNDEGKGKDHCGINPFTTKNSLLIKFTDFYIVLKMLVPRIWCSTIPCT